MTPLASAEGDSRLLRRGIALERATIGWNIIEASIALGAGVAAGSIALEGFGLDSGIEIAAAALVLARLRVALRHGKPDELKERRVLRSVTVTFVALALYLIIDGTVALISVARPTHSTLGIVITTAALVIMPMLAIAKRRTGIALGNQVLVTEASESMLCALLAAATLLSLGIYAITGWAWVDPVAGFVIAGYAVKEAIEARRGELCD